jgi:hypothetical protein
LSRHTVTNTCGDLLGQYAHFAPTLRWTADAYGAWAAENMIISNE